MEALPLRMGTTRTARRKGLVSAGAGFSVYCFHHPASLNRFSPFAAIPSFSDSITGKVLVSSVIAC